MIVSMSLVLLISSSVVLDDPTPPTNPPGVTAGVPAPSTDKSVPEKSQETPEKKSLHKKGGSTETQPQEKSKTPADDDAPIVDSDRPIPNPDQPQEKKNTEEQLDQEMGKELEASKNDDEDPLNRLTDEMRRAEEMLAKLESGDETVGLQQKIVKGLEELLKKAQQPPSGNSSQSKSKKKQNRQMQMQQTQQRQKSSPTQLESERAKNSSDRIGPPRASRSQKSPQPEERDVWGHLSEMMRGEMSQYAKENFLTKYRDMIERYYTDIARRSQDRTSP
jgi:hypothetical protein